MTDTSTLRYEPKQIVCPKHGTHSYTIDSTIPGYEGHYCQICWLETLGPSLSYADQPMTDFSPDVQELLDESYESDLTEEESEELLSMCGHGIGPKLSPAAQACVTAFQKVDFESGHFTCEDMWIISREVAAAALRAAANQMAAWADEDGRIELGDILAIAAELDRGPAIGSP